jgi:hypothetical protein
MTTDWAAPGLLMRSTVRTAGRATGGTTAGRSTAIRLGIHFPNRRMIAALASARVMSPVITISA